MTQTARNTPWWLRFHDRAQEFARQVIESVETDLAAISSAKHPEPNSSPPSQDAESTPNEGLHHAFGSRWQQHHHDTKDGSVNSMLLHIRQQAAPAARNIDDVASSTRHRPINAPHPALN